MSMKEKYANMGNKKLVRKLEAYETDKADKMCLDRWFA